MKLTTSLQGASASTAVIARLDPATQYPPACDYWVTRSSRVTTPLLTIAFYCAVVRVLATMKIDNEPSYKEVLLQYPIPGVN